MFQITPAHQTLTDFKNNFCNLLKYSKIKFQVRRDECLLHLFFKISLDISFIIYSQDFPDTT
jgi:hypothetical protein